METLKDKVARVMKEIIAVIPYDPRWPEQFQEDKDHLLSCLPRNLVKRIDNSASTAVPGLAAKPIVDMLVEVTSLIETRQKVPLILEPMGYDYSLLYDIQTGEMMLFRDEPICNLPAGWAVSGIEMARDRFRLLCGTAGTCVVMPMKPVERSNLKALGTEAQRRGGPIS